MTYNSWVMLTRTINHVTTVMKRIWIGRLIEDCPKMRQKNAKTASLEKPIAVV